MTGLLTALLLAQGLQPQGYVGFTNWNQFGDSTAKVVVEAPLASTGPLLPEDSGTVSHVYWDGASLQDSIGNSWSMNGTVPQTAANVSPFVPGKAGAGPYSAANTYQGSTSLMEWAGDWSVTVVWKPSAVGTAAYLVAKGTATAGWSVQMSATGALVCSLYDGALKTSTTTNTATVNAINVGTCGRSGTNLYSRLNSVAAPAPTAVGTMTSGAAQEVRIGRWGTAGNEATTSVIYEVPASTTAYSDALHLARYQRVFGMLTQQGQAISVTRATDQTYTANSLVWSTPNGTLSTSSDGAEVWKAATNYVLNSATHPKTTEATASLGTGAYVGWHAGTAGTMTIAAGTATVTGLSCTAVAIGTLCPFTVTVAGTMSITTSAGTVTHAQIEAGSYATPQIITAAGSATRNAVVATTPLPDLGNKWCISVTYRPGQAWNDASVKQIMSTFVGAVPNAFNMARPGSSTLTFNVFDSSGGIKTSTWTHGKTDTSSVRLTGCNNQGTLTLCANGVSVGTPSGAGTGIQTATLTPLYLGSQNGGSQVDGSISNLKVCKGATKCGDCR